MFICITSYITFEHIAGIYKINQVYDMELATLLNANTSLTLVLWIYICS
jgi:hypothetical protein